MKTVVFYGASDDLVEVEGDVRGCDEYPTNHGRFEVAGLHIEVSFGGRGVWAIQVSQIDEDVAVTAEDFRLDVDGYTMRLTMDVPDGAYVSEVTA